MSATALDCPALDCPPPPFCPTRSISIPFPRQPYKHDTDTDTDVLGLHSVADSPGSQTWHWLEGLSVPAARHSPEMRQYPPLGVQPPLPSQVEQDGQEKASPTQAPKVQVSPEVHSSVSSQGPVPMHMTSHDPPDSTFHDVVEKAVSHSRQTSPGLFWPFV